MKTCSKCGEEKELSEFWKRGDKPRSQCKVCETTAIYEWRANNREARNSLEVTMAKRHPGRQRKHMLNKLYGLTLEEFDKIVEDQHRACKICQRDPGPRGFQVDHDHSCCPGIQTCGQCIRGLLCIRCNRLLGLIGDSVDNLLAAVEYLEAVRD